MLKLVLLTIGGLAVVAVTAMVLSIGPRNVIGMLLYDQRKEGGLKVGDPAPDVALVTLEGTKTRLAAHFGDRPTVLIFGSFT